MGVLKVDYNRPLLKKSEPKTGIEVYMYLDEPGVYYNSFEQPVDEKMAVAAGFDTFKYGKLRQRKEQLSKAMAAIDKDLQMQELEATRDVIMERAGFKVIAIGMGRHIIEDPEGGKLTDRPLTLEEAKVAFDAAVPVAPVIKSMGKK